MYVKALHMCFCVYCTVVHAYLDVCVYMGLYMLWETVNPCFVWKAQHDTSNMH